MVISSTPSGAGDTYEVREASPVSRTLENQQNHESTRPPVRKGGEAQDACPQDGDPT